MSYVYLIEAQNGVAKIGCARDPYQRLATIRTHSPVLVRLIAMWQGVYADERALHARFDAYRLSSEWFQIDGALRKFIAEKHGVGLDDVSKWDSLLFRNSAERAERTKAHRRASMREVWSDPAWKLDHLATLAGARACTKALGRKYWLNKDDPRIQDHIKIHQQGKNEFLASPAAQKLRDQIATRDAARSLTAAPEASS
jgi:hypothetical protein